MYTLLILFFISLIGITFMVGRKLVLVKNGHIVTSYPVHPFIPDLHKVRHLTFKSIKNTIYIISFITIKSYIKSSNFLKNKYIDLKNKIKNIHMERSLKAGGIRGKAEVNKFLKLMSDYKHKIREIKHKINEEENNL